MNTKLTLSLNKSIIEAAKYSLLDKDESLSGMVEEYFRSLLIIKKAESPQTPVVSELTGIVKDHKNVSSSQVIADYLLDKYR